MTFPKHLQLEIMDCGPVCIKMIAEYYKKHYTLSTLRKRCYITREGVSLLGISDAAESVGFHTNGVKITLKQLAEEALLPCILHWNQNHFVVCYKIKRINKGCYKFYISGPASGLTTYDQETFEKCWLSTVANTGEQQGTALLLEPSVDFDKIDDDPPRSTKRDLLYFVRYFTPYKKLFFQVGCGMLVGSILQMLFPILTQSMVDIGINGKNINFITLVLIVQMTLFIAKLFVEFIRGWIMLHINSRINIALISDFLAKLMRLPLAFFDTKMTGDLIQRIGYHGRIKSLLMNDAINIIFSSFNFIVFSIIMGIYNLKVLIIFLTGNILYVIWVLSFMRYRRELDIRRFNQSAGQQSNIIQLIQGMQEIKLNNCEKQKRWEWERIQVKLFKISLRGLSLNQIQQAGSTVFTQGTQIIISYIIAKSVIEGDMTLGMMMSVTYILGMISSPIGEFLGLAQSIQDAKISLERLNEIHDQVDEEENIDIKLTELPKNRDLHLENVSFSYTGSDRDYALKNVSLTIPENKVTAIVGASGSGKTTIIKLLQGFYEPTIGTIKIGNTPLSAINPHTWRSKTGSVMQDGFIFSDTIANNIAVGEENIDPQKLRHATTVANIEEFILSLPLGYSTKIGMEGNGLSAGQKQRILIARAVYKTPEFIFLDEATNSLDTGNERIIMENLTEFYKGKTVVVVAHRLSTVCNADNIIVMDNGTVSEEGTPEELIHKQNTYYKLVKNQIELNLK